MTPNTTPAANPAISGAISARILVVEDNPINLKVACRLLQHCGYQPDTAANGQLAIERLKGSAYDLVFMDVEMPVLDGPAATAELRRLLPPAGQPVVVALTAHAMPGDRERFLAAGMDDHLTKPLRSGELSALLQRLPDLLAARRQPASSG